MIVRSVLDILLAVVDILSTWIFERDLATSTQQNTPMMHTTLALCILTVRPDLTKFVLLGHITSSCY